MTSASLLSISLSPSLRFTVPGSTMESYVHISNLSYTIGARDRQMAVSIFAQLHHRGHIHTEYGHVERSLVMSGEKTHSTNKSVQCWLW